MYKCNTDFINISASLNLKVNMLAYSSHLIVIEEILKEVYYKWDKVVYSV